jgi:trans-aconitate methyltransferase
LILQRTINDLLILVLQWDAERYQTQHNFVFDYGSSLVDVLNPQPGERILDLGCGTGELTREIMQRGANVLGIDADAQMISQAKVQNPSIDFRVDDAQNFSLDEPVDGVFSNAALHWVTEAERTVICISRTLKPGGRFVAEFGGRGNIARIASCLGRASSADRNPWYFPSIAEYSSLLERHGFEVTFAQLYDRPTPLNEGDQGLRNWILMFGGSFLAGLTDKEKERIIKVAENELRPYLYKNGQWTADYRRIRVVAVKR